MRVLVLTTVHPPLDARIHARQVRSMLNAGFEITYAAPFSAFGVKPPNDVRAIDVPRSAGKRRLPAIAYVAQLLTRKWREFDAIILHDPELLLATLALNREARRRVIWDVHEDLGGQLSAKPWLPRSIARLIARIVPTFESWAERRFKLMLAEHRYAARFENEHPVVPNTTWVPESRVPTIREPAKVIYIGGVTAVRGWAEIRQVARDLVADGVVVHVVGPAAPDCKDDIAESAARGEVVYHGFVANDEAMELLRGSLAGLSLLHPIPNYITSMPTKVLEYMANGVPYIATELPEVRLLSEKHGGGFVVPFSDTSAVVEAVRRLTNEDGLADRLGDQGHRAALRDLSWNSDSKRFVSFVASVAAPTASG